MKMCSNLFKEGKWKNIETLKFKMSNLGTH